MLDKLGFVGEIFRHPSLAIPVLSLIAIVGLPVAGVTAVSASAYWIIAAVNAAVIVNERTRQYIAAKHGQPEPADDAQPPAAPPDAGWIALVFAVLLAATIAASIGLFGCSDPQPIPDNHFILSGDGNPAVAATPPLSATDSDRGEPSASPRTDTHPRNTRLDPIFFDFDSAVVHREYWAILQAIADLAGRERILIVGHCDERGSVEYNARLGIERAQAVRQYLIDLGIISSRINIASAGKLAPVCDEHRESCWSRCRRADISIL